MEMDPRVPPLPSNWTILHSITHLLTTVCIADGVVDDRELTEIGACIMEYGRTETEDEAAEVLNTVIDWHNQVGQASEGDDSLLEHVLGLHCQDLIAHTSERATRLLIRQMVRVANADGHMDESELSIARQTAAALGLHDLANDIHSLVEMQRQQGGTVYVHPVFQFPNGQLHRWPVVPLVHARTAAEEASAEGNFVGFSGSATVNGRNVEISFKALEFDTGIKWMGYVNGYGVASDEDVETVVQAVTRKLMDMESGH